MDVRSDIFPDTPDGFHPRDVSVRLARPDERIRWDRLMNQHHYLGFKRFPGRGLLLNAFNEVGAIGRYEINESALPLMPQQSQLTSIQSDEYMT